MGAGRRRKVGGAAATAKPLSRGGKFPALILDARARGLSPPDSGVTAPRASCSGARVRGEAQPWPARTPCARHVSVVHTPAHSTAPCSSRARASCLQWRAFKMSARELELDAGVFEVVFGGWLFLGGYICGGKNYGFFS